MAVGRCGCTATFECNNIICQACNAMELDGLDDIITNALAAVTNANKRRAGPRGLYLIAVTGVPHLYSIAVAADGLVAGVAPTYHTNHRHAASAQTQARHRVWTHHVDGRAFPPSQELPFQLSTVTLEGRAFNMERAPKVTIPYRRCLQNAMRWGRRQPPSTTARSMSGGTLH